MHAMHAMHAYVGACMLCMYNCICLYAYAMHACVDVGTQVRIYAYGSICLHMLHGMHIPLAWGAHPGYPTHVGGGTVKPGTQDIYMWLYSIYEYI